MPGFLTQVQRRAFADSGIVFPLGLLSQAETTRYRGECDDLERLLGGKPRTIEVRQMHLHFGWAYELASHPRVLDAVEDLLGPDLLVWATELFAKHPSDTSVAVGWHRDRRYLGFLGGQSVTAWIALSASTPANGCMRALPRHCEQGDDERVETGDVGAGDDDPRRIDITLRAGEISLHDADVLHGSAANRSQIKRIGFVVRYVTPDARPKMGRPPTMLVRGTDRHGHFLAASPPTESDADAALAAMRQSAAHHLQTVLENIRPSKREAPVVAAAHGR